MGTIQHHTIVITTWRDDAPIIAAKAASLGCTVAGPTQPAFGFSTVCVAPDGSKEGWTDSDEGDVRRNEFVAWLESKDHAWVEVAFGELGTRIVRGSKDRM